MENQEITKLIQLSQKNDRNAFRELVEKYQYMIFSVGFRILGNEEDARDIVQETFIKLWLNIHKYDHNQKLSTWLYRIATNICLDYIKSSKKVSSIENIRESLEILISEENTEKLILNTELADIIQFLVNELSPKQKIVFTLRYLEGIEVEEIIDITGLSANKIKSNLYLARQIIRKKLEKY